jgi:glycosyltransferase involved in cell wall biosynthesis
MRRDDQQAYVEHLETFCRHVYTVNMRRGPTKDAESLLRSLVTGKPFIILRDNVREMKVGLQELVSLGSFDVIHADQMSMAQFALFARRQAEMQDHKPKIVLDAHNALYRVFSQIAPSQQDALRRWGWQRETRLMETYEKKTCLRFDHVVFVTDEDRNALVAKEADNGRFTTIPICVDLTDRPLLDVDPNARTITHLGTMFWPPNVEGVIWFAREVFPRVLAERPDAQFVIIGKNPPKEIDQLLEEVPNIQVTGYMPNPQPYLTKTAGFIVPLHAGAGMRVKILDAWAWGLPVITTTVGREGIDVDAGNTALVADDPETFAQHIVDLLNNADLRALLRSNGRAWVDEKYSWQRIYTRWDNVYEKLLAKT